MLACTNTSLLGALLPPSPLLDAPPALVAHSVLSYSVLVVVVAAKNGFSARRKEHEAVDDYAGTIRNHICT